MKARQPDVTAPTTKGHNVNRKKVTVAVIAAVVIALIASAASTNPAQAQEPTRPIVQETVDQHGNFLLYGAATTPEADVCKRFASRDACWQGTPGKTDRGYNLLGRDGEPAGFDGWAAQPIGDWRRIHSFIQSAEGQRIYAGLTNEQFVRRVFFAMRGTWDISAADLAYQVRALQTGTGRTQLALDVTESSEAKNRLRPGFDKLVEARKQGWDITRGELFALRNPGGAICDLHGNNCTPDCNPGWAVYEGICTEISEEPIEP